MLNIALTPAALATALVEACADQQAQLIAVDRSNTTPDPIYGDPIMLRIGDSLLIGVWMAQHFFLLDAYEWQAEQHRADGLHMTHTIDLMYENGDVSELARRIKSDFIRRASDQLDRRASRRKHATEVLAAAERLAGLLPAGETHREADANEASVVLWSNDGVLSGGIGVQLTANWSPLNNVAGVAVDVSLTGLTEQEAERVLTLLCGIRARRAATGGAGGAA